LKINDQIPVQSESTFCKMTEQIKSRLFGRLFICMVWTLDCGQFLFQVFDLGATSHKAANIFALKLGLGA